MESSANSHPSIDKSTTVRSCCSAPAPAIRKRRRRRSRARPPPPITRVLALDKSHFKSLVHQFTHHGAPHHPPLPAAAATMPPSPLPIPASPPPAPPLPPSHPAPADLAIAQSLQSTLQTLLSYLQLLHGLPPDPALAISPEEALSSRSRALSLLQELYRVQAHERVSHPDLVAARSFDQLEPLKAAAYVAPQAVGIPVISTYDHADFNSAAPSIDNALKENAEEITALSMQGTDWNAHQQPPGHILCTTEKLQPRLEPWTDAQVQPRLEPSTQQPFFPDQREELERFLFEDLASDGEDDNFFLQNFCPMSTQSSFHYDLLTLTCK